MESIAVWVGVLTPSAPRESEIGEGNHRNHDLMMVLLLRGSGSNPEQCLEEFAREVERQFVGKEFVEDTWSNYWKRIKCLGTFWFC